jgi:hypothetical protein
VSALGNAAVPHPVHRQFFASHTEPGDATGSLWVPKGSTDMFMPGWYFRGEDAGAPTTFGVPRPVTHAL